MGREKLWAQSLPTSPPTLGALSQRQVGGAGQNCGPARVSDQNPTALHGTDRRLGFLGDDCQIRPLDLVLEAI